MSKNKQEIKNLYPDAMKSGVSRFPVRVYYEDTDMGGIVYHANYLKFIERARRGGGLAEEPDRVDQFVVGVGDRCVRFAVPVCVLDHHGVTAVDLDVLRRGELEEWLQPAIESSSSAAALSSRTPRATGCGSKRGAGCTC